MYFSSQKDCYNKPAGAMRLLLSMDIMVTSIESFYERTSIYVWDSLMLEQTNNKRCEFSEISDSPLPGKQVLGKVVIFSNPTRI